MSRRTQPAATDCPNCGAEVPPDDAFCGRCGANVAPNPQQPPQPAPGTPPAGQPTRDDLQNLRSQLGRVAVMLGSALAALGAFLPWFSAEVFATTATKRGIEADGKITLALAIAACAIVVWRWGRRQRVVAFLLGLIVLGLGVLYISDPTIGADLTETQYSREELRRILSPGSGLYLTAIGGLAMALGPVYHTLTGPNS